MTGEAVLELGPSEALAGVEVAISVAVMVTGSEVVLVVVMSVNECQLSDSRMWKLYSRPLLAGRAAKASQSAS